MICKQGVKDGRIVGDDVLVRSGVSVKMGEGELVREGVNVAV